MLPMMHLQYFGWNDWLECTVVIRKIRQCMLCSHWGKCSSTTCSCPVDTSNITSDETTIFTYLVLDTSELRAYTKNTLNRDNCYYSQWLKCISVHYLCPLYQNWVTVQGYQSPSSYDKYGTAPSGRWPSAQVKQPGLWVIIATCRLPVGYQKPHPPSLFSNITEPESWHSFYHPTEGSPVDLGTAVRVCSLCPRLYIKLLFYIGVTV